MIPKNMYLVNLYIYQLFDTKNIQNLLIVKKFNSTIFSTCIIKNEFSLYPLSLLFAALASMKNYCTLKNLAT